MGGVGVALAIVVGLLSSFIQSLGLTIQRKSHIQNDALPLDQQRTPARRPLWLIGFGIYITSNIFATIFQLDTLPIVILAPLGAVSLIFNALLARLILGDRFGKRTVAGTALVAVGATLIAVFGVVQEEEHGIKELLRLWARPAFLGFFGTVTGLTVIVLAVAHIATFATYRAMRIGRIRLGDDDEEVSSPTLAPSNYASPCHPAAIPFRPTHARTASPPPLSPRTEVAARDDDNETTGLLGAADIDKMPTAQDSTPIRSRVRFASLSSHITADTDEDAGDIMLSQPTPSQQKTLTLAGLAFAACSGVISGMSLVLAKAAVELLVMTLDHYRTGKGANQFAHPQSWILVAGLAVGGVAQLVYLNYSLCFASPALICPLAFCFFNISSIFDGLVFYDQFSLLSPTQIGLVSTGVAVLLLGVMVVSAVQPTGEGGVDVGTWVEDECAIDEEDEEVDGKLPDQSHPRSASPDQLADSRDSEDDVSSENTIRASLHQRRHMAGESDVDPAPSNGEADLIGLSHSTPALPPAPRTRTPLLQRRSTMPHEDFSVTMPPAHTGSGTFSPSSPMSPSTGRKRRRRYGSLLPLPLPYQRHNDMPAAPGFAIGLGAASPGFMLRSEHEMSHLSGQGQGVEGFLGRGRRVRSQSEGQEQIARLIRPAERSALGRDERRRSVEGSGLRPVGAATGLGIVPASSTEEHRQVVRIGENGAEGRRSWWKRFLAGGTSEGRIKLSDDPAGGA